MKTNSIRFRLTAWYAGLLSAVVIGFAGLFFLHLKSYLENALGESQLTRARQIAGTLVANAGRTGDAYVAGQVASLYAPEKSDRFIRLTERDGRVFNVHRFRGCPDAGGTHQCPEPPGHVRTGASAEARAWALSDRRQPSRSSRTSRAWTANCSPRLKARSAERPSIRRTASPACCAGRVPATARSR